MYQLPLFAIQNKTSKPTSSSSTKFVQMKLSTFTLAVSAVSATLSMPAPRTAAAPSIEDGISAVHSILQMKTLEKSDEFEQLLDLLKTQLSLAGNYEDSGRLSSPANGARGYRSSLGGLRACRCSNLARGIQPSFCRNFHCIPN